MHVQTHILSGWLAGNLVPAFGPRERFFCMLAASLSDLDGLSLLGGWECYYDYHHVLAHNLPFAVVLAGGLAFFSQPRVTAFIVYFLLAHLHLLLDLSVPGRGGVLNTCGRSADCGSAPDMRGSFTPGRI